ncbi:hypothetical protein [Numidum massiliense]|uniref:hypothetical protein n=1 Tax=Numidum massiliense TaxID=1522315 RepID=UPI0011CC8C4F|nr:hypothetical protein [Numidum massiliense]
MNTRVYVNDKASGTVPDAHLPLLRQLCKQGGVGMHWEAENRNLYITTGLFGKKIVLQASTADRSTPTNRLYGHEVAKHLAHLGAKAAVLKEDDDLPPDCDLYVRYELNLDDGSHSPQVTIFHDSAVHHKRLAHAFLQELTESGWRVQLKKMEGEPTQAQSQVPVLHVQCMLPINETDRMIDVLQQKIAVATTTAILRYFHGGNPLSALFLLVPHYMSRTATTTDPIPEASETVSDTVDRLSTATDHIPATTNPISAMGDPTPAPTAQTEVFFDYNVFVTDASENEYLILGNLYIKNSGTIDLHDPVICLLVSPPDNAQLGGQILPPNIVATTGVHDGDGVTGWQFLDEDWFKQAKTRGEYWLKPTRATQIPPQQSEAVRNFQFAISKPAEGGAVTIRGMVYFREQQLKFPAHNAVAITF